MRENVLRLRFGSFEVDFKMKIEFHDVKMCVGTGAKLEGMGNAVGG